MKLYFNDLLYAFSYALDCVERDLVGVTTNHSKRVAYMCVRMGKYMGLQETELSDLAACALLHDNALTEYIKEESIKGIDVVSDKKKFNVGAHCIQGEKNAQYLPFFSPMDYVILYHHENADGSGPFHKKEQEVPLFAAMIRLADGIDAAFDLSRTDEVKYKDMLQYVEEQREKNFSAACADAFLNAVDFNTLQLMQDSNVDKLIADELPSFCSEYTTEQVRNISTIFAKIIDYKSKFTKRHSLGIAQKAYQMGEYYHLDEETKSKLYLAGALHDLGKLSTDVDVLEKPDKLTDKEFSHIKNHAYETYRILKKIKGFEDIAIWASLHHEKLNGKGYPFGLTKDELGFEERLMGCLDIYQALTEERPYKAKMTHEKSISILKGMAERGFVDVGIVKDIDKVYETI